MSSDNVFLMFNSEKIFLKLQNIENRDKEFEHCAIGLSNPAEAAKEWDLKWNVERIKF